jgi:PAS domain S-box-containing protein
LLREGISFREGDQMFGSDRWIELFGFENNELTVSDFEQHMVKEDLVQYNLTLEKLSKKNPTYTIKYRIENNGRIEWIEEHGKMIIHRKKMMLVSLIKPIDIQRFPSTDVDVLNTLKNEREMREEMQQLHRKKQPYHLVLIHLTNIPIINEKYGRDIGDLMMGEYLSKLRFKFIKDNRSLFRISGIRFALLIKEKSKFDILDRALVGAGELFTTNNLSEHWNLRSAI